MGRTDAKMNKESVGKSHESMRGRRSVDLAAEDKNDKKPREGAPTTTDVVWHLSCSYGYSLKWVAGSHQVRTKTNKKKLLHSALNLQ